MPKLFDGNIGKISLDRDASAEKAFNDMKKQKERRYLERTIGRAIEESDSSSSEDDKRESKLPKYLRNDSLGDTIAAIKEGRLDRVTSNTKSGADVLGGLLKAKGASHEAPREKQTRRKGFEVGELAGVKDAGARAAVADFFRTHGTWDSASDRSDSHDDGAQQIPKSKPSLKRKEASSEASSEEEPSMPLAGPAAPPVRASDGEVLLTRPRPGTAAAGVSLRTTSTVRGDAKRRRRERKREEEAEALGLKRRDPKDRLLQLRKEASDVHVAKLMKMSGLAKRSEDVRKRAEAEFRKALEGAFEEGAIDRIMKMFPDDDDDASSDSSLEAAIERRQAAGDGEDDAASKDSMDSIERILAESDSEDEEDKDEDEDEEDDESDGSDDDGEYDAVFGAKDKDKPRDKAASRSPFAAVLRAKPPRFRFSYISVPKESFGLTDAEVLAYDDRTLAAVAPIKAYAPYRGGGDSRLRASASTVLRTLRGHRAAPSDDTPVSALRDIAIKQASRSKKYRIVDSVQVVMEDPQAAAAAHAAGMAVVGTAAGAAAAVPMSILEDAEGGGAWGDTQAKSARSRSSNSKGPSSHARKGDSGSNHGTQAGRSKGGGSSHPSSSGRPDSNGPRSSKGQRPDGKGDGGRDDANVDGKSKGGAKGSQGGGGGGKASSGKPATPAAPTAASVPVDVDPSKLSRSQRRKFGAQLLGPLATSSAPKRPSAIAAAAAKDAQNEGPAKRGRQGDEGKPEAKRGRK